jgi:cysteine desulfurase/selenocysteine lyase
LSFTLDWGHPSDVSMILDQCGVAVRSGHHCCMPLMSILGVDATIRASFGLYTNTDDIDALIAGLKKAKDLLG